jgi:hypothetical protein
MQQVLFMVLKLEKFKMQIKNNWKGLTCGAGGGRRSSAFSCVGNEELLHIVK